ncbi:hypothetical protein [Paenibacillus sp. P22]|uniref:hypothetical protein n=1 Tax=Paenibacillus sp. P22 TaxID=483908 RepID=UPI00038F6F3C|nr:hypothetical protein [Paenibacillus sp. P22]CDN45187.1 hypothetical protein BN871_GR_00040 [Paenibacillus sp. P22]
MKISELIEELEIKLRDFGDIETRFSEYDGTYRPDDLKPMLDVTVEEVGGQDVLVIWDK